MSTPFVTSLNKVWDTDLLTHVWMTQPGEGGVGGGGGLTDAELRASEVNVSVVSGVLNVCDGGGNPLEVSTSPPAGTQFGLIVRNIPSGTQAVSGPLTDAQLRAVALPVTVSGAVTANAGSGTMAVSGPVTDTQLRAVPLPVSGSVDVTGSSVAASILNIGQQTMSNSIPVVLASNQTALPVAVHGVTDNAGSLTVDAPVGTPVFVRLSDGSAAIATLPVSLASVPSHAVTNVGTFAVQVTSAPSTAVTGTFWQAAQPVTAPTLTKGTQGAGFSTQDLKDAGRVNIMWTAEFSPVATAEAMLTITESRDGGAVTTFTSKVVTSGKRLRITSIDIIVENTLGVNPKRNKFRMKFNTAGAVTTASPLQGTWIASVSTAVNTVGVPAFADFPDGIEYLGDGTKQIGFSLESPDWVTAAQTSKVYITVFAFEY